MAYRYTLRRSVAMTGTGRCAFIMLNPSTADAEHDDPTIRRCMGFARAWGFAELVVGNLFAFRSTDPAALAAAADPVGPMNDGALIEIAATSERVVCAWGNNGTLNNRAADVRRLLYRMTFDGMVALEITGADQPKHPLYVRADIEPVSYPLEDEEINCWPGGWKSDQNRGDRSA